MNIYSELTSDEESDSRSKAMNSGTSSPIILEGSLISGDGGTAGRGEETVELVEEIEVDIMSDASRPREEPADSGEGGGLDNMAEAVEKQDPEVESVAKGEDEDDRDEKSTGSGQKDSMPTEGDDAP